MWESLALSPVCHETLRKLPNPFQLYLYLIIKMTVRKPVSFLLLLTCEAYILFKVNKNNLQTQKHQGASSLFHLSKNYLI